MSLPAGDGPKPDLISEAGLATTSKSGPDVFGDIDKRLSMLLDRANKIESTLNRLNIKRGSNNSDPELNLISTEEVDDEYSFDVNDLDLDAEDHNSDKDDDNVDEIDLDAHDD